MTGRKTGELFASFITGKTHEEHGVTGVSKLVPEKRGRFIQKILPKALERNLRGVYRTKEILKDLLAVKDRDYIKQDLEIPTLFEKISNSRSMFVPSYNPSAITLLNVNEFQNISGNDFDDQLKMEWEYDFKTRRRKFFSELENDIVGSRDFLMVHFHRPDKMQHKYGDLSVGHVDKDRLRKRYKKLDKFAGQIREKADDYDYIIFMSDHGLVEKYGHNKKAFYSCNKELFPEEKPHITDFHDKILHLTGNSGRI